VTVLATDQRVAAAELEHIDRLLRPPCQVGPYALTGHLARSATALLFTARGPAFGGGEGVLKLTGTVFAPILRRELDLLLCCAAADLDGVVRPAARELVWLQVGGPNTDRPAAALALPFLAGGDLGALATRAARAGQLGPDLALSAARPIASALRGLLEAIDRPLAHGDVRPQNVLLPRPNASLDELVLIDLDAARELGPAGPTPEDAAILADDVAGFGRLLCLLATGDAEAAAAMPPTSNRPFDTLLARCGGRGGDQYASLADARLWHDLAAAEAVARPRPRPRPLVRLKRALRTLDIRRHRRERARP